MFNMVNPRFTVDTIRQEDEIALDSRKTCAAARLAVRIICTTTCHVTEAPTTERHVNEIVLCTLDSAKLWLNLPLGPVLARRPSS